MKNFILVLCFLVSTGALASVASLAVDIEDAKEVVRDVVSTELRYNEGRINADLDISEIDTIVIGTNILKPDSGVKVRVTVYPEEKKCQCQDVLILEMTGELKNGKLEVSNGASVVQVL